MTRAARRSPCKQALTIVELLVLLGVAALVIAILLPTIARVRESASRAACASNLRQIGQLYTRYALENRGGLPTPMASRIYPYVLHYADGDSATGGGAAGKPKYDGGRWFFPYVRDARRIFQCPSAPDGFLANNNFSEGAWPTSEAELSTKRIVTQYVQVMTTASASYWADKLTIASRLTDPPNCLLGMDLTMVRSRAGASPTYEPVNEYPHRNRGNGLAGANVLTLDGSVRWFDESALRGEVDTNVVVWRVPTTDVACAKRS